MTSAYKKTDTERAERLSKLLQAGKDKPLEKIPQPGQDEEMVEPEVEMQVDGTAAEGDKVDEPNKKISTAGPRLSGRREWKVRKCGTRSK